MRTDKKCVTCKHHVSVHRYDPNKPRSGPQKCIIKGCDCREFQKKSWLISTTKENHMKAQVLVVSGKEVHTKEIEHDDLKTVQAIVKGWVERVDIGHFKPGLVLWCNEDGRMQDLPKHATPFLADGIIRGNYVVSRDDENGFASLNPGEADDLTAALKAFIGVMFE